jgi:hypothetical protein
MAIEQARVDLQRLRRRIGQLEAELVDVRAKATKLEHFIEMASQYGLDSENNGAPNSSTNHLVPKKAGQNSSADEITSAAAEVIKRHGRPVRTRDILVEIEKMGIVIVGKNPTANLSAYLSRSDRFVADRTQGWILLDDSSKSEGDQTSAVTKLGDPSIWD